MKLDYKKFRLYFHDFLLLKQSKENMGKVMLGWKKQMPWGDTRQKGRKRRREKYHTKLALPKAQMLIRGGEVDNYDSMNTRPTM